MGVEAVGVGERIVSDISDIKHACPGWCGKNKDDPATDKFSLLQKSE
jgi:hypothetical protein